MLSCRTEPCVLRLCFRLPPADVDECLEDVCAHNGTCTNNVGSFQCECFIGFKPDMSFRPVCQGLCSTLQRGSDEPRLLCYGVERWWCSKVRVFSILLNFPSSDIDECYNSTVCGPESLCHNTLGSYTCTCKVGYAATDREIEPSESNVCIGVCVLCVCWLHSLIETHGGAAKVPYFIPDLNFSGNRQLFYEGSRRHYICSSQNTDNSLSWARCRRNKIFCIEQKKNNNKKNLNSWCWKFPCQ